MRENSLVHHRTVIQEVHVVVEVVGDVLSDAEVEQGHVRQREQARKGVGAEIVDRLQSSGETSRMVTNCSIE